MEALSLMHDNADPRRSWKRKPMKENVCKVFKYQENATQKILHDEYWKKQKNRGGKESQALPNARTRNSDAIPQKYFRSIYPLPVHNRFIEQIPLVQ